MIQPTYCAGCGLQLNPFGCGPVCQCLKPEPCKCRTDEELETLREIARMLYEGEVDQSFSKHDTATRLALEWSEKYGYAKECT